MANHATVITVYHDGMPALLQMIASVYTHHALIADVIIVNNSNERIDHLSQKRHGAPFRVRIIESGRNIGFGAANNLALRRTQTDYVLLLNPDAQLTGGFLEAAIVMMDERPEIAAVGPKLVDFYGNPHASAFTSPSCASYFIDAFALGRFVDRRRTPAREINLCGYLCETADWLCGAAVVLRRKVLDQIGRFDEDYFLYYEDTDLFMRIRMNGSVVMHCPQFIVRHVGRNEDGLYCDKFNSSTRIVHHSRSVLTYWRKHGRQQMPIVRAILCASSIFKFWTWALLMLISRKTGFTAVRQRLRGYAEAAAIALFE